MNYPVWMGHAKVKALGWVSGLLALLSGVSCIGRDCDLSLKQNPMTVHESDITLSQPATIVEARFCVDTTCQSTSLDTTNLGQKSCFDFSSSPGFCLTPLTPDTLHIGGSLSTHEGPPPPSSVQLTITDPETGATLFDRKSRVSVHDFDSDGCHTTWTAEATL